MAKRTTSRTMLAAQQTRLGPPEVLEPTELPVPEPGPGQVRVRVEAASVNFADVMRRGGRRYPFPTPLPFVPGSEVAGTVDALGDGVAGPPVGTPVFALVGEGGEGGYAQFAIAQAPRVIPIPPSIDPRAASGLLVAGATAALILGEQARLGRGEWVFIPAAAGGVGTFAVQLAKQLGARVIAGASTDEKRDAALALGADAAIDYRESDWPERVLELTKGAGVDVLLEMMGGRALELGLRCLAPFGRAIVYGEAGAPRTLSQDALDAWLARPALNQSITAFNVGVFFGMRPERAGAAIERIVGGVASGALRASVGHVLPLAQAAEAHRMLEGRRSIGKIVLEPWA